ncbi:ATP-dependent Clp protease proteolytic subunit [Falsochrobactrum sp. TDYN1]|uniref:ATP-dependent Clp protease proteolytic subunit n=1 Tax=Falsochrobactrum tianjinense TaxID=2706015 RepID=A0A949UVE6_9HYPH|nr:ATP-dependent Clp protease proteolytic subunit [Falsochrobactrum sp. TDYN1]MBV2144211.1 ATP-dependent Clp protease proteolytic subunit [Falsochrobactrum sp. TDYN1]
MAVNLPIDKIIFSTVEQAEQEVENALECDVLYYYGEIRTGYTPIFRDVVEQIAERQGKRDAIGICLTTPGGQVEAVENMVEILRHHYNYLYAIVPRSAMSAGTILCMAADKIFMDYSSSLGPIDPQVPDRENKNLVPALGYLDKVKELIDKSLNNTISPAEFHMLQNQDLAMLRFYEQSRELSISLLKDWLTKYKFKDWTHHRTNNPGAPVTDEEKRARAEEIATMLSNNNIWHSHGRMISMSRLMHDMKLEIEDFGANLEHRDAIRRYSQTLTNHLERQGIPVYMYNRHVH